MGSFGRGGRSGGFLDRVIYRIRMQFTGESVKNTFPDRVIYQVILQFSLLDRVIYWVILQFHFVVFVRSPFGTPGVISLYFVGFRSPLDRF